VKHNSSSAGAAVPPAARAASAGSMTTAAPPPTPAAAAAAPAPAAPQAPAGQVQQVRVPRSQQYARDTKEGVIRLVPRYRDHTAPQGLTYIKLATHVTLAEADGE
jgi:hypothetical protein